VDLLAARACESKDVEENALSAPTLGWMGLACNDIGVAWQLAMTWWAACYQATSGQALDASRIKVVTTA